MNLVIGPSLSATMTKAKWKTLTDNAKKKYAAADTTGTWTQLWIKETVDAKMKERTKLKLTAPKGPTTKIKSINVKTPAIVSPVKLLKADTVQDRTTHNVLRHGEKTVAEHRYGIPYDRAKLSDIQMMSYLKNMWKDCNKEFFNGRLKLPYIRFLKNTTTRQGTAIKKLAHWFAKYSEIAFHRRVFNAGEKVVYETMLHEMCHQAVTEIDKEHTEDAHGPKWQAWMMSIGQPVDAKYKGNFGDFMTNEEKAKHGLVDKETKLVNVPKAGLVVQYLTKDKWGSFFVSGILCCKVGKKWAVLSEITTPATWALVPESKLLQQNRPEKLELYSQAQYKEMARGIAAHYKMQ